MSKTKKPEPADAGDEEPENDPDRKSEENKYPPREVLDLVPGHTYDLTIVDMTVFCASFGVPNDPTTWTLALATKDGKTVYLNGAMRRTIGGYLESLLADEENLDPFPMRVRFFVRLRKTADGKREYRTAMLLISEDAS